MLKFLLNANLSWETAGFLKTLGYEAKTVAQFGLTQADDQTIVDFAIKKKLVIITLDLDFGEIYYFSASIRLGVIVLKLKDQTVESVNKNLEKLLATEVLDKRELAKSLIVFDGKKIRIRRKE